MKTCILFEDSFDGVNFYVVDGDHRHLDEVVLGCEGDEEKVNQLNALLFNEQGAKKLSGMRVLTKDVEWDVMIKCGIV